MWSKKIKIIWSEDLSDSNVYTLRTCVGSSQADAILRVNMSVVPSRGQEQTRPLRIFACELYGRVRRKDLFWSMCSLRFRPGLSLANRENMYGKPLKLVTQ